MRILSVALLITCLSGCGFVGFPGVYKINVEQGNIVTEEIVDQLKPGMSRRQVRFIMGTPLVEDTFHPDRWDYVYVKRNGAQILDESRLTVIFAGDTLLSVSGDYQPAAWLEDEETAEPDAPAPETDIDSIEIIEIEIDEAG
jgi:outer membrane protein assembly factor BamE